MAYKCGAMQNAKRLANWVLPGLCAAGMALAQAPGYACGWSVIDHKIQEDTSGPWNPKVYRTIVGAATLMQVGGALWEGAESRFGLTMWRGFESELVGGGSAELAKHLFTRVRPSETDDPCLFFQHDSHYSFPSGEAAVAAALVTPYVLEYAHEQPATYGLLLLPLYVGVGRVKANAHWQSDVLAGWAIGGLSGWYEHNRDTPVLVQVLPHRVVVGLKVRY
jgi:undecaprenyl-diphosphatase